MSSFAAGAEQHDKLYDRSNASIGPIQNPAEWSSHAVSMGRWRGEALRHASNWGLWSARFFFQVVVMVELSSLCVLLLL